MTIATKSLTLFCAGCLAAALSSGPQIAYAGEHGAKPAHDAEAKGEGDKGKEAPNDPTEVAMPPVIVPVTRDGTLIGYLYVGVILKAEDATVADEIQKSMPLVQDATLRVMNDNPVPVEHAEDEGTKDIIIQHLEAALAHVDGVPPIKTITIHDILKVPF